MSSNREVVVEKYRKGYEEYIIDLLLNCFKSYSRYGLTLRELIDIPKRDPGVKLENSFIAFVDGKPAGLIQVVERRVKIIGGVTVSVAGIANVCVLEEYRGLRISSRILEAIHNYYLEKNYPLAGLLTGYGSIAHSIYLRNKYVDVHFTSSLILSQEDLRRLKSTNINSNRWNIASLDRDYYNDIMRIYDNETSNYTGVVIRDNVYWESKIFNNHPLHTFFYGVQEPRLDKIVLDMYKNTLVGYALISSWLNQPALVPFGRILVKEFYSIGSLIEKTLVLASLVDAVTSELKPKSIAIYSPNIYVFKDIIGLGRIISTDETYMFRALDIGSLAEKVAEGLTSIAQKYGLAEGVVLRVGKDYYGEDGVQVEVSANGLVRLSFASNIGDLLVDGEVTTSNSRLIKLLLQDYKTHIDYIDRW